MITMACMCPINYHILSNNCGGYNPVFDKEQSVIKNLIVWKINHPNRYAKPNMVILHWAAGLVQ